MKQSNPTWSDAKCLYYGYWNVISGKVHFLLDALGFVPGAGEVSDGINGGIYLLEGDNVNASLSFAAMVPIGGWATTAGKWIKVALMYDGVGGYVSKSGLVFKFLGRGARAENRIDHVLGHMKDNLDKDIHGIFNGTAEEVISLVDEAWEKVKRNGIGPSISPTGSYNYIVDMGRVIGKEGGMLGSGNSLTKLLISTQPNSNAVLITAYPIR